MRESSNPIQECTNCNECCKKGGPAFHLEDKHLIESATIPMTSLFTIRQGEPILDNVKDSIIHAETDIIKIKGKGKSWVCVYLDEKEKNCSIYQNRPLECQALKCWNTDEIESLYQKDRLTRKDLISGVEGLWEFIEDHQQKCSYGKLAALIKNFQANKSDKIQESILEMIKYDLAIRPMMVDKGKLDRESLDFLLGMSIIETIGRYGVDIVKENDSYRIK